VSALLFAMVDAVLSWGFDRDRFERSVSRDMLGDKAWWSREMAKARQQIGWWRSLWPLGGGE